jgi:hypothetical protein
MMATRAGTARIHLEDTMSITLQDLLYVPNLTTNLVSFSQLIKSHAVITTVKSGLKIKLKNTHTVMVKHLNNIFELPGVKWPSTETALTLTCPSPRS